MRESQFVLVFKLWHHSNADCSKADVCLGKREFPVPASTRIEAIQQVPDLWQRIRREGYHGSPADLKLLDRSTGEELKLKFPSPYDTYQCSNCQNYWARMEVAADGAAVTYGCVTFSECQHQERVYWNRSQA